jgi:hypothetical protein
VKHCTDGSAAACGLRSTAPQLVKSMQHAYMGHWRLLAELFMPAVLCWCRLLCSCSSIVVLAAGCDSPAHICQQQHMTII